MAVQYDKQYNKLVLYVENFAKKYPFDVFLTMLSLVFNYSKSRIWTLEHDTKYSKS